MNMMNVQRTDRNKDLFVSPQLKLSPDSVCETMPFTLPDRLLPVKRNQPLQVPVLKRATSPIMEEQSKGGNSSEQRLFPALRPVQDTVPNLPPRSPIGRRPRSVSESDVSSAHRRAIFGQYWDQGGPGRGPGLGGSSTSISPHIHYATGTLHQLPISTPPQRHRSRSSSLTILDSVHLEPRDYRMYAPPKDHAERSPICGRFASVQDVPMTPMLQSLPPLPSPLQRLCSHGSGPGGLQGMYPMTTPIPILRQSSYRCLQEDAQDAGGSNRTGNALFDNEPVTFNLTKSFRIDGMVSAVVECSGSDTSSSEGRRSGPMKGSIRFDPRVTVTEFQDPITRSWYDDDELDGLRRETLLVAQEYLVTHPDQAQRYSRCTFDPITGTYRKKALFSLPVLSASEDETFKASHKEYDELVKSHVQSILIVDPNKAILDLFCKTMHSMFPNANISKTQRGEEALEWAAIPGRNFDIIIVEERLAQPVARPSPGSIQNPSLNKDAGQRFVVLCKTMSEHGIVHHIPSEELNRPGSFSEASQRVPQRVHQRGFPVSGSHLLRLVHNMEVEEVTSEPDVEMSNDTRSAESCSRNLVVEGDAICTRPIPRKSLLIGVSMRPDRDAKAFQTAGADIVWGKPIPRVGEALRNQLVQVLVNKRRNSLAQVTTP